jgi:hypothetical protein
VQPEPVQDTTQVAQEDENVVVRATFTVQGTKAQLKALKQYIISNNIQIL